MPPQALRAKNRAHSCEHSLLSIPEIPFNNQSLLNDIRQSLLHNICYRVSRDITAFAVGRFNPDFEQLHTLTGITRTTAKADVLSVDYPSIIDDVLPAWAILDSSITPEDRATIDARLVTQDNFSLKPIGYVPAIHDQSRVASSLQTDPSLRIRLLHETRPTV